MNTALIVRVLSRFVLLVLQNYGETLEAWAIAEMNKLLALGQGEAAALSTKPSAAGVIGKLLVYALHISPDTFDAMVSKELKAVMAAAESEAAALSQ